MKGVVGEIRCVITSPPIRLDYREGVMKIDWAQAYRADPGMWSTPGLTEESGRPSVVQTFGKPAWHPGD